MSETIMETKEVDDMPPVNVVSSPGGWWVSANPESDLAGLSLAQVVEDLNSAVYVIEKNGKQVFTNFGMVQLGLTQAPEQALPPIFLAS